MTFDQARARAICDDLMEMASKFRSDTGRETPMLLGFYHEGDVGLIPAVALDPEGDKDTLAAKVRFLADRMGAEAVFTLSECWVSMNPFAGPPSEDPARIEALMVTASAAGVNLMLTRPINGDGTLGQITVQEGVGGRFTNLSGREMMN